MLTIVESDLISSIELSIKGDKALQMLAEEKNSTAVFADYLDENITYFVKVLSEKESSEDIILALNDMETVWTNAEESSMVKACTEKKNVGASYIDIYDPENEETFGVFVILFK